MEVMFFEYFIYPGLLFSLGIALIVSWIYSKATAVFHGRIGPRFLHPVFDFIKLMKKETIVPRGSNIGVFLFAPVLGLSAAIMFSMIIFNVLIVTSGSMVDVFSLMYVYIFYVVAIMLAAASSANPVVSVEVSRLVKNTLIAALPVIASLCVVIIKTAPIIDVAGVVKYQEINKWLIASLSGFLAFYIMFVSIQLNLFNPLLNGRYFGYDLNKGPLIEYGGPPAALFLLARLIMQAVLPLLPVVFFLGGIGSAVQIIKYLIIVLAMVVIRNLSGSLDVQRFVKLFLGPVVVISVLSIIIALIGL
jgi:NADH-quinone oxidoreductase subunit H